MTRVGISRRKKKKVLSEHLALESEENIPEVLFVTQGLPLAIKGGSSGDVGLVRGGCGLSETCQVFKEGALPLVLCEKRQQVAIPRGAFLQLHMITHPIPHFGVHATSQVGKTFSCL